MKEKVGRPERQGTGFDLLKPGQEGEWALAESPQSPWNIVLLGKMPELLEQEKAASPPHLALPLQTSA